MKKSIIIAAIITVVVIDGILLYFFLPRNVSYTFEGMIAGGVVDDEHLVKAQLKLEGKKEKDSFIGTATFTVDGVTQKVEVEAETNEVGWKITSKTSTDGKEDFSAAFMPNSKMDTCAMILRSSSVHEDYEYFIFCEFISFVYYKFFCLSISFCIFSMYYCLWYFNNHLFI